MTDAKEPLARRALDIAPRAKKSNYPEVFARRMEGREKRSLGDAFGLTTLGVNLTRLPPGAMSALRHAHATQDELVYVLEGTPTLITDRGDERLAPGMVAGFPAGTGDAHHLVNRSTEDVLYLEIGDRGEGDQVTYPDDDLAARRVDGRWSFTKKDGTPY